MEQLRFDKTLKSALNSSSPLLPENVTMATSQFNQSSADSILNTTNFYALKQSANDTTTATSIYDLFDFDRDTCIYIYSGVTVATIVISLVRSFAFFKTCMRASRRLHDRMFDSITRATMRFFNTNPSGRILNRFSKDMGAVDELLPSALIDCLQIGLTLLGIIVVVAIVNAWLLLPTFIVGFIFYLLRNFYLATGRSVKRLEGVSKCRFYIPSLLYLI